MRIPILIPNYRRSFPPLVGNYVPRIILPLKLPRHTIEVPSNVDVEGLRNLVAKHYPPTIGGLVYVHRLTTFFVKGKK